MCVFNSLPYHWWRVQYVYIGVLDRLFSVGPLSSHNILFVYVRIRPLVFGPQFYPVIHPKITRRTSSGISSSFSRCMSSICCFVFGGIEGLGSACGGSIDRWMDLHTFTTPSDHNTITHHQQAPRRALVDELGEELPAGQATQVCFFCVFLCVCDRVCSCLGFLVLVCLEWGGVDWMIYVAYTSL